MRTSVLVTVTVLGCWQCGGGSAIPPTERAAAEALVQAGAPASRCTTTATAVSCPSQSLDLSVSLPDLVRRVHYELPLGTPPPAGWPVALVFQGSFISAALSFHGTQGEAFGMYYQALTLKQLLDAGFAVLAPEAHIGGTTFWDTNVPPWSLAWELSPDHSFMAAIFAAIATGRFGALDPARLYAAGISSGGYMTSRMAVSYPGKFKALAIQSASYATCGGALCVIPALPANHPPTLFLHGHQDLIVPESTMQLYHTRLVAAGCSTQVIVHNPAGHQWIPEAPTAIVAWFQAAP